MSVGDEAAEVSANQFHCLFCEAVREGIGVVGQISFHRVNQSVNAASCCDVSGSGHDQFGIQDGELGQVVIAEDGGLEVSLFIGDNSGSGDFGAGASGGGDCEDGNDGAGNLEVAFIVEDLAAIGSDNADCLSNVHGAAAAQRDDAGSAASLVLFSRVSNDCGGGVCLDVQISGALQASFFHDVLDLLDNAQRFQAVVGDQKNMIQIVFLHDFGQLLQCANAEFDGLGNHKLEVFHFLFLL